jgi:hypothetical protein
MEKSNIEASEYVRCALNRQCEVCIINCVALRTIGKMTDPSETPTDVDGKSASLSVRRRSKLLRRFGIFLKAIWENKQTLCARQFASFWKQIGE